MRKFAISDIHGCRKTFLALLEKIQLSTADELYLLGDYVDRGPDSKGVIDEILALQKASYQVHCLMGNHESMMADAFSDDEEKDRRMQLWLQNGGGQTLQSFTTDNGLPNIPEAYFQFIERLQFYFAVDRFLLVHAGLNFRQRNPLMDVVSMLWIRNWYDRIERDWLNGRIIVHGHTPIGQTAIRWQYTNLHMLPALNIDAGCVYYGQREGMGDLCAFELTTQELYFQPNVDVI